MLTGTPRDLPHKMKRLMWLQKTPVRGKDEDKDGPSEPIDNSVQGGTSKKDKEAALQCRHHPGKVIRRVCLPLYPTYSHTPYFLSLFPILYPTKMAKLTYNVSEMDLLRRFAWFASMSSIPRA